MKNKKINIILLFIALFLVLYFSLKDNLVDVIKSLSNINIYIFIFTILLFLFSLLFKALSLCTFLREYYPKYKLKKTYELTVIGQFLNGITPFQSGGQPFQIYLLKKEGKRITDSTNAMLKDHLAFQMSLIIMASLSVILNTILKIYKGNNLTFLVMIGFIINIIVLLLLIIVISAKKTAIKIINKILDFIYKLKISNKFSKKKEDIIKSLEYFYETGKEIRRNKKTLILGVFYNMCNMFILYIIPYFVFLSLGVNNIGIIRSCVATSFVMLIGNFIPIPGATGGIEYGFLRFFSYYVIGHLLTSAMLIWRFITYILAMFIGFIVLTIRKAGE